MGLTDPCFSRSCSSQSSGHQPPAPRPLCAHPEGAVCAVQKVWTRGCQQHPHPSPIGSFSPPLTRLSLFPWVTRCSTRSPRSTQPPSAGGTREDARNIFTLQQQRGRTAPARLRGAPHRPSPAASRPSPPGSAGSPPARGSQAFVRLPRPGSASDKSPSLMRGCQRSAGSGFLTPAQPDTAGDE